MKQIIIQGVKCIGPNFSRAEFSLIKRNLAQQEGLDTLADSLGAAANLQRLKILYLLSAHKEMCVCDLAEVLELSDSGVSQHLSKLRDRNIVKSRRMNQTMFYSLVQNVFTSHLVDILALNETKQKHAFVLDGRS